jgi:hypothetical protein
MKKIPEELAGEDQASLRPSCPYIANKVKANSTLRDYFGMGFEDKSLSFFPFSVGDRCCPAIKLVLQVSFNCFTCLA